MRLSLRFFSEYLFCICAHIYNPRIYTHRYKVSGDMFYIMIYFYVCVNIHKYIFMYVCKRRSCGANAWHVLHIRSYNLGVLQRDSERCKGTNKKKKKNSLNYSG